MDNAGLTEFIEAYARNKCLWDRNDPSYSNRISRKTAQEELLKIYQRFESSANLASVRKKIDSLRTAYLRELRKVQASEFTAAGSHDVYVPSLWYYNMLNFLAEGQEIGRTDSLDDEVLLDRQDDSQIIGEIVTVTPQPVYRSRKRKVNVPSEFLKTCASILKANSQPISEYDAIGINLSKKLAKMDPSQAVYAESLICSVIRRGILNKLTEETDFCENGCSNIRSNNTFQEGSTILIKNDHDR